MGSNETAITIPGGPRVIDVLTGDGAPSGPNHLLFSDPDRLTDSLWDRSGVGWSPTEHAPVLGAPQRALDRKLWGIMVQWSGAQRTCLDLHPPRKRPRMRCRRLHVSNTDPEKPPSDLRATNRLDSTGAAGHFWWPVGARELNFFFSTPRKFRIDIPGPRTAQTIFKQLQGASHTFYPGITRRARTDVRNPSTPSPRPPR